MARFDAVKKFFSFSKKAVGNVWSSALFGELPFYSGLKIDSDATSLRVYSGQVAWVSAAIDAITRDVVSQEYFFINKKTGNIIENNALPKDLLLPFESNWNGIYFQDCLSLIIPNLLLTGNAFLWKVKNSTAYGLLNDTPANFIPLPSDKVKIELDQNGEGIVAYRVQLGNTQYIVPPAEMIHFRQNAIFNPFVGVGNISKARLLIEGEVSATDYVNTFLIDSKNAPTMTIIDKTPMQEKDKIRMSEMLKDKWSNKIMYLNVEDAEVQQNSLMTKDFKFLEKRQADIEAILAVFGVPKIVLGIPSDSNRSTSQNQIPLYYKNTINTKLREIAAFFNNFYVNDFSSDIKMVFRQHSEGDIDEITKMVQSGIISPNRASELLGEEFDLLDEYRNKFYLPGTLVALGDEKETVDSVSPTKTPVIENPDDTDPEDEEKSTKIENKNVDLNDPRNVKAIVDFFVKTAPAEKRFQQKYLELSLKTRNTITEKFIPGISEYFKRQHSEIKNIIETVSGVKDAAVNYDEIQNAVEIYLNTGVEPESGALQPLHTSGVQRAVADINGIYGSGIIASVSNPFVKSVIDNLGKRITGVLTETTLKDLREIFRKSMLESWNINQIQDAIQSKFTQYQTTRARMIARTESRMAWDAGAQVAYQDLGIKKIDIVGCTMFEWNFDCGKKNIPVELITTLNFHPNHIGTPAPSTQKD